MSVKGSKNPENTAFFEKGIFKFTPIYAKLTPIYAEHKTSVNNQRKASVISDIERVLHFAGLFSFSKWRKDIKAYNMVNRKRP